MPRKPIDIEVVNKLWGFYKERQAPAHILKKAKKARIKVSRSTVQRLVNNGFPERGIVSFKQRFTEIEEATAEVVDRASDQSHIEAVVANISGWRQLVDQGMVVVAMLMDRAHEKLKPRQQNLKNKETGEWEEVEVPLEAKDLRAASDAVKTAFGAMKQAAETHDIWNLQSGVDADGRDTWVQDNFGEFSNEEHAAFRDHSVWPSRIEVPKEMQPMLESGQLRLSEDGDG